MGEQNVPLLLGEVSEKSKENIEWNNVIVKSNDEDTSLTKRVWVESKKLWEIVGPAIVTRLISYTMLVITQAFAGHLGDLELAAMSISFNVIIGLDVGLLLGMASALETLCGQAFGANKEYMLGIYLQRSWIVLIGCCILLLPLLIFCGPLVKLLGQPEDVADMAAVLTWWIIPVHFSLAFQFPLVRFLQCQGKAVVFAWASVVSLVVQLVASWLFVYVLEGGIIGIAMTLNLAWWVLVFTALGYVLWGGCPNTWTGFSMEAFSGLWDFLKLSASSGVMLCLENWYYKVLVLLTGNLNNAKIALDALAICMAINSWEIMIPLAFFAGVGVRVANELGAGNGKGAKFATIVAVMTSIVIGVIFWLIIIFFHDTIALIFTTSEPVLKEVDKLSVILAFTILLNSVQHVLSGVAVGSGWQSTVAYVNIGCYYFIGVPLGFLIGWKFNQGVMGIWAGMVIGTAVQTLVLIVITTRCDWDKEAQKANLHVKKWEKEGHVTRT